MKIFCFWLMLVGVALFAGCVSQRAKSSAVDAKKSIASSGGLYCLKTLKVTGASPLITEVNGVVNVRNLLCGSLGSDANVRFASAGSGVAPISVSVDRRFSIWITPLVFINSTLSFCTLCLWPAYEGLDSSYEVIVDAPWGRTKKEFGITRRVVVTWFPIPFLNGENKDWDWDTFSFKPQMSEKVYLEYESKAIADVVIASLAKAKYELWLAEGGNSPAKRSYSVRSLSYDPATRKGFIEVIVEDSKFDVARKWTRAYIETLSKDKNVALVASEIPEAAKFFLGREEIRDGKVLYVEFETE